MVGFACIVKWERKKKEEIFVLGVEEGLGWRERCFGCRDRFYVYISGGGFLG